MKQPNSRRSAPKNRAIAAAPSEVNLAIVAERAHYTGSPYHKDVPSFAGPIPAPRPDASICPRELSGRREQIDAWLKAAILNGQFAADWRNGLPHIVWHREADVVYEACLTNSATGEYHGYPLEAGDRVRGLT